MDMPYELTLLKEEEIWGFSQLKVLKKYGVKAAITDLAILTGAYVADTEYNIEEDKTLKGRVGWQWTSSDDKDGDVRAVDLYGNKCDKCRYYLRDGVVRPALQSSAIFSQISPNIVRGYNGVEEVECGEFPQMAPDKKVQDALEKALQSGKLKTTGKKYTFDSVKCNEYERGFQPVSYDEYEYEGKKYIRVKANTCYNGTPVQLSNGEYYKDGDFVWIEVQPVRWLVDRKNKKLIAKKGLASGIRYLVKDKTYTGDFTETEMYSFLNTILIKEMIPSTVLEKQETIETEEDEISQLISKIKRLIEPLDDKKEQEIINKVNQLIENYNKKITMMKSDISFDNSISLNTVDFNTAKMEIIAALESIIQSLYENERLLNILDEINDYMKLLSQELDIPVSIENRSDQVIYMIAIAKICDQPIIIEQLKDLFEQISMKISTSFSQTWDQEISLTLENMQSVQTLFSKMINNIFKVVHRYYIIQMALRGIGENELAKEIQKLYEVMATLETEQQKNYDLEITKIKEEFNLDICVNNDINVLTTAIKKRIKPVAREVKFYGGAIAEVRKEIVRLLERPEISQQVREKSKQQLISVLQRWGENLKNDGQIQNDNLNFQNLDKDTIRQIQCLKELYNILYKLNDHILNVSKHGKFQTKI